MVRAMGMLSSSDLKHLAVLGKDAFVEAVPHWFEVDGLVEDFANRFWAAFAKLFLDVHLIVVQKTEMQLAFGCQAHPVAASAVWRRNGADEANYTTRSGQAVVPGFIRPV